MFLNSILTPHGTVALDDNEIVLITEYLISHQQYLILEKIRQSSDILLSKTKNN